jgi:hypothetical protein
VFHSWLIIVLFLVKKEKHGGIERNVKVCILVPLFFKCFILRSRKNSAIQRYRKEINLISWHILAHKFNRMNVVVDEQWCCDGSSTVVSMMKGIQWFVLELSSTLDNHTFLKSALSQNWTPAYRFSEKEMLFPTSFRVSRDENFQMSISPMQVPRTIRRKVHSSAESLCSDITLDDELFSMVGSICHCPKSSNYQESLLSPQESTAAPASDSQRKGQ